MVYLWALGFAMALWEITKGVRSGETSALGGIYSHAGRDRQPIRFWLFLAFNVIYLTAFAFFFFELKP
jgi:hypothetical protein